MNEEQSYAALQDSFGRKFSYLRLSLTERCNFACNYCLPGGYLKNCGTPQVDSPLTLNEISHLVTALSELGVSKVRLTGGEPTVRSDLVSIVTQLRATPGIKSIGLTTNGHNFAETGASLKAAGLTSVNISVDSLREESFNLITGTPPSRGLFKKVLNAVDCALKLDLKSVKVNAVLLKGLNEDQWPEYLEWVRTAPLQVRFIELMRTEGNAPWFARHHIPLRDTAESLENYLLKDGWKPRSHQGSDGPALVFEHPSYAGQIGLITPYSHNFCESCNRLRVTSTGNLRLCLFGDRDTSLRDLLQSASQKEELKARILTSLQFKPASHHLNEGNYGNTKNLASIGG